jgi:uncharacterized protein YutE (UPF0331/DUF86 family)
MCERALQVLIELCIDIAERLLALGSYGPVATAAEPFDRLHQRGILQEISG